MLGHHVRSNRTVILQGCPALKNLIKIPRWGKCSYLGLKRRLEAQAGLLLGSAPGMEGELGLKPASGRSFRPHLLCEAMILSHCPIVFQVRFHPPSHVYPYRTVGVKVSGAGTVHPLQTWEDISSAERSGTQTHMAGGRAGTQPCYRGGTEAQN